MHLFSWSLISYQWSLLMLVIFKNSRALWIQDISYFPILGEVYTFEKILFASLEFLLQVMRSPALFACHRNPTSLTNTINNTNIPIISPTNTDTDIKCICPCFSNRYRNYIIILIPIQGIRYRYQYIGSYQVLVEHYSESQ